MKHPVDHRFRLLRPAIAVAFFVGFVVACGEGREGEQDPPFDPRPAVPRQLRGPVAALATWIAGDSPLWRCRYTMPVPPFDTTQAENAAGASAADSASRRTPPRLEPVRVCNSVRSEHSKILVIAPGDTVLGITRVEGGKDVGASARFDALRSEIERLHGAPEGGCEVAQAGSPKVAARQRIVRWRAGGQPLSLVLQETRAGDRVVLSAGASAASCPEPAAR